MRRILTMSLLTIGLSGGVALADSPREHRGDDHSERRNDRQTDHRNDRQVDRRNDRRADQRTYRRDDRRIDREEHFRDYRNRPAARYERNEYRSGFYFVAGEWTWNGYEWLWVPGHYVRNYR